MEEGNEEEKSVWMKENIRMGMKNIGEGDGDIKQEERR